MESGRTLEARVFSFVQYLLGETTLEGLTTSALGAASIFLESDALALHLRGSESFDLVASVGLTGHSGIHLDQPISSQDVARLEAGEVEITRFHGRSVKPRA